MADLDFFSLMREATRRVEAEITGALLVQVTGLDPNPVPSSYKFWYYNFGLSKPDFHTATINYQNGHWGIIELLKGSILGALQNDLLRIEVNVAEAVALIRNSGYSGPLAFGGLLQPVVTPIPPNPLYNFHEGSGSPDIIFVDAVTGKVSTQTSTE